MMLFYQWQIFADNKSLVWSVWNFFSFLLERNTLVQSVWNYLFFSWKEIHCTISLLTKQQQQGIVNTGESYSNSLSGTQSNESQIKILPSAKVRLEQKLCLQGIFRSLL